MARMVGLSRTAKPQPLLQTIRNQKIERNQEHKLARPVAVDADPLSSDDEDDESSAVNPGLQLDEGNSNKAKEFRAAFSSEESDNSSSQKSARANIKRTTFSSKTAQKSHQKEVKSYGGAAEPSRTTKEGRLIGLKRQRTEDDDCRHRKGSSKLSRTSPPRTAAKSTDHLRDERGFTKRSNSKFTYGRKDTSSQESEFTRGKRDTSTKRAVFRDPGSISSPEKPKTQRLRAPPDDILSSPAKGRPIPTRTKKEEQEGNDDLLSSPTHKSVFKRLSPKKSTSRTLKATKPERRQKALSRSPSPAPLMFKIPDEISHVDYGDTREGVDASAVFSDEDTLDKYSHQGEAPDFGEEANSKITLCPWCEDPVEEAQLREFSKGKRLNVRMQTRFCHNHKKQTAKKEWEQKQYPQIQWDRLEERFAAHRDYLMGLVQGESSHFRSILAEKIETGKARTLRKEENLNPGYYGPRGFNLMCDYLVNEFGDLLKEKAVSDDVIAGRGSAAFIQAVMVAELAIRLIREDLDVSEEKAIEIMEESKQLGEMVHEEI